MFLKRELMSLKDKLKKCPDKDRPFIEYMSSLKRKNLVGVEIGVYTAANANRIINRLNIKKLYLIDPYEVDSGNFNRFEARSKAVLRVSGYGNTQFIFKKSSEAVKDIDGLVDFVYIDGSHQQEDVTADLFNYYNLVKDSGIIAGDNYEMLSVKIPVDIFSKDVKAKLTIKSWEQAIEWWFIK